jgi:hypothetical protein
MQCENRYETPWCKWKLCNDETDIKNNILQDSNSHEYLLFSMFSWVYSRSSENNVQRTLKEYCKT